MVKILSFTLRLEDSDYYKENILRLSKMGNRLNYLKAVLRIFHNRALMDTVPDKEKRRKFTNLLYYIK